MSNLISKDNLRTASQRSKTFTNEKILELTNAIVSDLSEFQSLLEFFNAAGFYIDDEGDIAQADEEEEDN